MDRAFGLVGEYAEVACRDGPIADFHAGGRPLPRPDTFEEVLDVGNL